ncbi:DNA methyltransferase, partial [Amylibacter sp.]|nr:DNA methyltransferase [Amylibacter sp.]
DNSLSDDIVSQRYSLKNTRDWRLSTARKSAGLIDVHEVIEQCAFRPFDNRWCIFSDIAMDWPRSEVMRHMARGHNIGLATARSNKNPQTDHFFVVDKIMETKCAESSTQSALFPLYLYPDEQDLDQTRRINFDPKLWKKLQKLAKHPTHGIPDEVQTFDYIYGTLHCPAYRETYTEFLKIDFPRIPWPSTPDEFWDISAKGAQLRGLHLMEPASIGAAPYPFTGEGDNVVDKPVFEGGKIWINPTQYFDAAPDVSWGFYIGGYQPAQKWLKDRKGRALSFDDVKHYQRILKILSETDRIMKTITMNLSAERRSHKSI